MDEFLNDPSLQLLGDLSTEEFQKKLYHWLEERGTLPILRTYLRHQLISTLKQSHPSASILNRKRDFLSPKVHALNLLVAEYLFEQNYYFTVSVLHSEEPRLGRFSPEVGEALGSVKRTSYLQVKDVEDILGTLNVRIDSNLGKRVSLVYFSERKNNRSTSLLRIIFNIFGESELWTNLHPNFASGDPSSMRYKTNGEHRPETSVLTNDPTAKATNFGMPVEAQLLGKMEKTESSQSHVENLKRQLIEWNQKEFEKRMKVEVMKLREEVEKETATRQKKFKDSLLSQQQQCIDIMNQLRNQQVQVKMHLKEIQQKEQELKEREAKLEEAKKQDAESMAIKHNDILQAQQQLMEGFKRLEAEKKNLSAKSFQKEMDIRLNQIFGETIGSPSNSMLPHYLEKRPQSSRTGLQQSDDISNSGNTKVTSVQQEIIHAFQQMRDENEKLLRLANEHQSKIKLLTAGATQQAKQLEEARAALRLLSSHDSHLSEADTKNSMEERLTVLSMRQGDNKGAREAFPRQKEFPESRSSRFKHSEDNPRSKTLRRGSRQFRYHDSESDGNSSSSPTEEVIREARRRLQRLEKESDEVDKQFFRLRQRQLTEDGRSSGLGLSGILPGTLQEKDIALPVYSYIPATQNFVLPVVPTHHLLQGSVAMNISSETADFQQYHRKEAQTAVPTKNNAHMSSVKDANSADHPSLASAQVSSRAEIQASNESRFSAGGTYNNQTPRVSLGTKTLFKEMEENTSYTGNVSISPTEVPIGREHKEINATSKNEQRHIFQSHNDFPTKDNQRSVHFESVLDKKNDFSGHIKEKNHFSAMSIEKDEHGSEGNFEEETPRKRIERGASVMMELPLTRVEVGSEQNGDGNPETQSVHNHTQPKEAKARITSVSESSEEDSSSPKLSVGINDINDNDNSDLW
ncbi:golgin subfamily A member 4-like isoform X2 [Ischnura elegans]|nr:golgin subfamily A member 4-like isoform X2 [Ischnura elegans]